MAREINPEGANLRYERHSEPGKTNEYTQAIIGTLSALNDKSMKRMFWDKVQKSFFSEFIQDRAVERLT